MNQGRIWCVVSPTVGLPLFLGSVAVTSLIVHACVMTHTTWMSNYWQGAGKKVAMNSAAPAALADTNGQPAFSMTVTPVPGTGVSTPASFVITVAPSVAAPAMVEHTASASTTTAEAKPIVAASVN
jgi:light-harvesting protein B-800-850 alpha chain